MKGKTDFDGKSKATRKQNAIYGIVQIVYLLSSSERKEKQ